MKNYLFIKNTYGNYETIYTDVQNVVQNVEFIINGVDVYKIAQDSDMRIYVGELIFASDSICEFSEMVDEFYKILEKYKEKEKDMKEFFLTHRITISNKVNREGFVYSKDLQTQLGMKKLEKLEDIEDRLGIDIVKLYKAHMQNVIYHKNRRSNKIEECNVFRSSIDRFANGIFTFTLILESINNEKRFAVTSDDYGKTWALTKEELKTKGENYGKERN